MEKRLSLYPQGPQVLHWLAVVTVPPLRLLAWVQELPPLRMLSSVEGPVQELPPLRVLFSVEGPLLQDLDGILLGQGAKVLDGALPLQPVHPWCLRATSNVRCGHPRLALGDFGRWLLVHLLFQDHSGFALLCGRKPLRGLLVGLFHHACDGSHDLHSNYANPLSSSSTAKS